MQQKIPGLGTRSELVQPLQSVSRCVANFEANRMYGTGEYDHSPHLLFHTSMLLILLLVLRQLNAKTVH